MYFSSGLIPTFILLTKLGFYNSRWVMIIPSLLSAYNVMVLRSAFGELSTELVESAQIDGANDWTILLRIGVSANRMSSVPNSTSSKKSTSRRISPAGSRCCRWLRTS